jgi:bifunctional non-homologous end joining protein LigD
VSKAGSRKKVTSSGAYEKVAGQLSGKETKMDLIVENETISLSHLDKKFWDPLDGRPAITKRDYLKAMCYMAPYLLPHWHGRPLTIVRAPDGVNGKSFFQKHWNVALPDFVETAIVKDEGENREYLLCNNLASLLFYCQHSVLEFHTFVSRLTEEPDPIEETDEASGSAADRGALLLQYPDYLIIDLDYHPDGGGKNAAAQTIDIDAYKRTCDIAFDLKENLEAVGLTPFVKTSGRNGLHIFVPVTRNVDFQMTKTLAETVTRHLLGQKPNEVTVDLNISKRAGKVYLDCSSNGAGKTVATAYTPRAMPWATVSTPILWTELEHISPTDLTLFTIGERLDTIGDPWADILSSKHDLHMALRKPGRK